MPANFLALMSLVPFTLTLPSTVTGFDVLAPAGAMATPPTPASDATATAPVRRILNLRITMLPVARGSGSWIEGFYGRAARRDCAATVEIRRRAIPSTPAAVL